MVRSIEFIAWYGTALGLLWLPPAGLFLAFSSLAHSRLRRDAFTILSVSLGAALCGSWALLPSLMAVAGFEEAWSFFGWFPFSISRDYAAPEGIIHCGCGLVTGAWVARLVRRLLIRVSQRSNILGSFLRLTLSAMALFFCYIPLAGFEDMLGGGSGYGEGVPAIFMRFFQMCYFPIFLWMRTNHFSLWGGEYLPNVLFISGITIVLMWCVSRLRNVLRRLPKPAI